MPTRVEMTPCDGRWSISQQTAQKLHNSAELYEKLPIQWHIANFHAAEENGWPYL